jgi:hypothetical protein
MNFTQKAASFLAKDRSNIEKDDTMKTIGIFENSALHYATSPAMVRGVAEPEF